MRNYLYRAAKVIAAAFLGDHLPIDFRITSYNVCYTKLLRIKPNLVQTLEQTLCLMHGGPFANIAHGCNSYIATNMAMHLADYVVTEAGFGADLGAEKFLDIKCRQTGLWPDAAVIVATIRALKSHGGKPKEHLSEPDEDALIRGMQNLDKHIDNLKDFYGLPVTVAINRFVTDTPEEIALVQKLCRAKGVMAVPTEVWEKGGEGGVALAQEVIKIARKGRITSYNVCYTKLLRAKPAGP